MREIALGLKRNGHGFLWSLRRLPVTFESFDIVKELGLGVEMRSYFKDGRDVVPVEEIKRVLRSLKKADGMMMVIKFQGG